MFMPDFKRWTVSKSEAVSTWKVITEKPMNTFNLDAALDGAPVKLRSGEKAYVRYCEEEYGLMYPLMGFKLYSSGATFQLMWTEEGETLKGQEHPDDIVGMWVEEFKNWDVFSEDVTRLEKVTNFQWKVSGPGLTDSHLYSSVFSPDFFPACEVGTVIERN